MRFSSCPAPAPQRPSGDAPASLGHGVGLRRDHFDRVLSAPTRIDWFEVISENFMVDGGRPLEVLERVRERYPVVLHGVSLSIGSTDPLNEAYLDRLADLAARIEPAWVSDHLCWAGVGGRYAHDLLPLPYTSEALAHVVARIQKVQERLGRAIAMENVSSYVTFRRSTMSEWDFLSEVARRSGCGILLDVNNIYVSARNHGFDPRAYIAGVPRGAVWQYHLAGHSDKGDFLLDTHDHPVSDPVWDLYAEAVRRFGPVSTLIEWDDNIPVFDRLEEESERARAVAVDAARAIVGTDAAHAADGVPAAKAAGIPNKAPRRVVSA
jgi:uncharacterized protein (UPF0276 family)